MEDPAYQKLMEYALRALSRRAHTTHEIREKLKKRTHHSEARENRVVTRLKELKLLDDEAYIQRAVESAANFRMHGPRKVAEKLYRKGIPFKKTQSVWDSLDISEEEVAKNALKKREKFFKKYKKEQLYSKRAQFLASRGFSGPIVFNLAKPTQYE